MFLGFSDVCLRCERLAQVGSNHYHILGVCPICIAEGPALNDGDCRLNVKLLALCQETVALRHPTIAVTTSLRFRHLPHQAEPVLSFITGPKNKVTLSLVNTSLVLVKETPFSPSKTLQQQACSLEKLDDFHLCLCQC